MARAFFPASEAPQDPHGPHARDATFVHTHQVGMWFCVGAYGGGELPLAPETL